MFANLSEIIVLGFIVTIIIMVFWILYLHSRIQKLTCGKDGNSLEESINFIIDDLKRIHSFEKNTDSCIRNMETRLKRSIQAIETVRFNPWKGTGDGGNQSFSTAIISEHGNGVVFSSMYSRDRVSVFSKPLQNFKSEFELTEEELSVLDNAKKKITLNI